MGDSPINALEPEQVASTMGQMLVEIKVQGTAAIGYNIYSWSMEQSVTSSDLKLVIVDNVAPSNETLADDSYPLRVYTYSYYNAGNENGKALTDWLLTEEGQGVITNAGYVGIFGTVPPTETEDISATLKAAEENVVSYFMNDSGFLCYDVKFLEWVDNSAQAKTFANEKNKGQLMFGLAETDSEPLTEEDIEQSLGKSSFTHKQYIVLTRDRNGGEWEVINSGIVKTYENGEVTSLTEGLLIR
jgi:hypothetical protein